MVEPGSAPVTKLQAEAQSPSAASASHPVRHGSIEARFTVSSAHCSYDVARSWERWKHYSLHRYRLAPADAREVAGGTRHVRGGFVQQYGDDEQGHALCRSGQGGETLAAPAVAVARQVVGQQAHAEQSQHYGG